MPLSTLQAREQLRSFWATHGPSHDDGSGHGIHAPFEQKKWRDLFARHIPPASAVVDIGAGTGYCALLLAQMGHQVTAVDWSRGLLAEAQKSATAQGLQFAVEVADIENTPFADARFDALTARHVLWTLLQPQEAIAEWSRILKPGGVALVDIGLGGHRKHYDDALEAQLPMRKVENTNLLAGMFRKNGFSSVTTEIDHHTPHDDDHVHLVIVARR